MYRNISYLRSLIPLKIDTFSQKVEKTMMLQKPTIFALHSAHNIFCHIGYTFVVIDTA